MRLREIVWKEGKYAFTYGYIGKVKVATVGYDMLREKGSTAHAWVLSSPFVEGSIRGASSDELKAAAPEMLMRFIRQLVED